MSRSPCSAVFVRHSCLHSSLAVSRPVSYLHPRFHTQNLQLFTDNVHSDVPAVPSNGASTSYAAHAPEENTIDESVFKTIHRDLWTIAKNVWSVLVPVNWSMSRQNQALRNWDLWGPLVCRRCHTVSSFNGLLLCNMVFSTTA